MHIVQKSMLLITINELVIPLCNNNVLYKAEKLSICLFVCLSALFGRLITQPCQHGLKQDLLEIKAVSLRITKFIFTSL